MKIQGCLKTQCICRLAGLPRKPGMSGDDLIKTKATIITDAVEWVIRYSPEAIIIVVTHPLDVMTYAAYKAAHKVSRKVFGMACILDTGRYKPFIADVLHVSPKDIHSMLLGGHGDTMVVLPLYTSISGIPVTELLNKEDIDKIVDRTRNGGGELVNMMCTSAWYAPGAAAQMVEAIVDDQQRIFPVCTLSKGEYGIKDVYMGVPVVLGSERIEEVIELKLKAAEMKLVKESADSVKATMKILDAMKLIAE